MNYWTNLSVEFASQKNYLDELYKVYPIVPNLKRSLDDKLWDTIETAYNNHDNANLIKALLKSELFPIKDSYVAYLRRDPNSIERNPNTINRIAGNLYQIGLDKIYENCTQPKETNRQIGPMFKRWVAQGTLGCKVYTDSNSFLLSKDNAILNISDEGMKTFAATNLGYRRLDKGLDFIARFNGKYIIAEAKFLTDFGGHQDAQFDDAIATIKSDLSVPNSLNAEVIKIAIMDGVLYIIGNNKMYKHLAKNPDHTILSSLILREYLYTL